MNAIMYLVKTGCQWRMLPKDFPPYNTVFYYFDRWKWEGVFEELMETLHVEVRRLAGREDSPSLGIIDSRSVKSSHHVDADRGIDGNKKMLADGGYRGQKLIDEAKRKLGIEFAVVLRPDESPKKFSVVPIRINPETHSRLAIMAKMAGISLNALISRSLDNAVANQ